MAAGGHSPNLLLWHAARKTGADKPLIKLDFVVAVTEEDVRKFEAPAVLF